MHPLISPSVIVEQLCIIMQDLPESQDTEPTSERAVTQLMEPLASQHEGQRIRDELRDCTLYSGVGVICDDIGTWKSMEPRLLAVDYKIITAFPFHHDHPTFFPTIAQSIAYPKPPAAAESSDSPPFVIAVFVSGWVDSVCTLHTRYRSLDIIDDIIKPFLPQSAPHLLHIPKLFFISTWGDLNPPPLHFPDDPDGNYCVVYHSIVGMSSDMNKWADHITDHLFLPGATVQEVIEKSHLVEEDYWLHYFTSLKNKLVLRK